MTNLRYLLSIQKIVLTPDGGGGFSTSWENIATNPTVHADISSAGESERYLAMKNQLRKLYHIRIRYRNDLDTSMRLHGSAGSFEILSLQDMDGKRHMLDLLAEKDENE
jgi:SPP1 family predicted phage head-tail adaptor